MLAMPLTLAPVRLYADRSEFTSRLTQQPCGRGYVVRGLLNGSLMVEESRMLQVSIFQTLQNNLATIDFSVLLHEVMTIADEVDSQLSQAMESYIAESLDDAVTAWV
jgi:hypothetical protein